MLGLVLVAVVLQLVSVNSAEVNYHAHVRKGLVEVLRLAGRNDEAREVIVEALARYEQKGNEVMAARAGALLEELSAAGG